MTLIKNDKIFQYPIEKLQIILSMKEWESLYQPKSLHDMIEDVHLDQGTKGKRRQDREERIDANLAKHESLVAAWQNRIQAKTRLEENAKNRNSFDDYSISVKLK